MALLRVASNSLKDNEPGINNRNMGIVKNERNERCNTCNCNANDCPGHFGYIPLFKPVFHVGYIKDCVKVLQNICKKCSCLLNKNKKSKDNFTKCIYCKEINYNYIKEKLKIYETKDKKKKRNKKND